MKGSLTSKELTECLTKEGEPFSKDEIDEMINFTVDKEKGTMDYLNYVATLAEDNQLNWRSPSFFYAALTIF